MKSVDLEKIIAEYSPQLKRISSQQSAMPHPLKKGELLLQSELDQLHCDIKNLSAIFEYEIKDKPPLELPKLNAIKPVVDYKPVPFSYLYQSLNTLFLAYDGLFISFQNTAVIDFIENGNQFKVRHGDVSYTFNTPSELSKYLASGKKAYLNFQFRNGYVKWLTEHDGNLQLAWEFERDQFAQSSSQIHHAFNQVSRLKRLKLAHDQLAVLKTLPFSSTAATRPVSSGLSIKSVGDGAFAKTVVHLLVKEDVSIGRLKRNVNDFLCAPSKGRMAIHLGPYIQECDYILLNGDIYSEVPCEITCIDCLKKIETINKKVKA